MKKGNTVCDSDFGIDFLNRWLNNEGHNAVVLPKDSLKFADKSHYSTILTGENLVLLTNAPRDVVDKMAEKCRGLLESIIANPLEDIDRTFLINNISSDDILFVHVSPCDLHSPCKKGCFAIVSIGLKQGFMIIYEKGEHCISRLTIDTMGVNRYFMEI